MQVSLHLVNRHFNNRSFNDDSPHDCYADEDSSHCCLLVQSQILVMKCPFLISLFLCLSPIVGAAQTIDFNRDVRPILSDNCFSCHGFDKATRKADLRLDTLVGATADRDGSRAIVPGRPDKSLLIERVSSADTDLVMPPADSHRKPLKHSQIEALRRWIEEGAGWGKHWAFEEPKRPAVAAEAHPIDDFVKGRLKRKSMTLAKRAEIPTLVRRLSYDLTGLPPEPAVVERLVKAPTKENWNRLIDELLASPHYGERMAMWWLDGARYSDTDGFQSDATRTNWPWRDWVIDSFNRNLPFDQFTIEQFAGDLIPNATPEQKLATCFHRNHMANGEGGRDREESRIDYVLDRTNTFGTLWLGLTLGCTQCHDHKFDPVSQRDYYSLTAYFNSIDETGAAGGGATPYLTYRSPYAKRAVEDAEAALKESDADVVKVRERAETEFVPWLAARIDQVKSGFQAWTVAKPVRLETTEGYPLKADEDGTIVSGPFDKPQDDFIVTVAPDDLDRTTGFRLDVFPHPSHTDGKYSFAPSGEFILTNVKVLVQKQGTSQYQEVEIASAKADIEGQGTDKGYGRVVGTLADAPRKGWTTRTKPADVLHSAVFAFTKPVTLSEDEELRIALMQRSLSPKELMGRFRLSLTNQGGQAIQSLGKMPMEIIYQQLLKCLCHGLVRQLIKML